MAQYYQVLNQSDEKVEEGTTRFYTDNQTVQYVIQDNNGSQQYQNQQLVVSSEELMVVENQGQVIIDQSQVAYQSPSYVINSGQQRQIYYMTNGPQTTPILVDQQPAIQQPVVLNHQLMQNSPQKVVSAPEKMPVHRAPVKAPPRPSLPVPRGIQIVQRAQAQNVAAQAAAKKPASLEDDSCEDDVVRLADGSLVKYQQYQKLMTLQKTNPSLREKLQLAPSFQAQLLQRRQQKAAAAIGVNTSTAKPRIVHKPPPQRFPQVTPTSTSGEEQFIRYHAPQPVKRVPPPPSNNQYLIQPPKPQESRPQRPLPQFLYSTHIKNIIDNTPVTEEFSDSIRMLVLLENGEQRLITFTLPKEACTIQEILEQVNVPFTQETPIQVTEANTNGINYVVAVGNVAGFNSEGQGIEDSPEKSYAMDPEMANSNDAPSSPEQSVKEPPRRLIPGKLAVCTYCGIMSEDFNRCSRCKVKFPDNVKAVDAIFVGRNGKRIDPNRQPHGSELRRIPQKTNGVPKMNLLGKRRPPKPSKLLECETVVVSSDEEEDEDKQAATKNINENLLKLGSAVTISPISKEPSIVDIQKFSILAASRNPERITHPMLSTYLLCRTVRIGSYRFVPAEAVRIDTLGFTIKVPHPNLENTIKVIKISNLDVVKVLISFQKSLPVLFFYLPQSVGTTVRAALDMAPDGDYYFDPLSEVDESYRRITMLPETMSDEVRSILQRIYSKFFNCLDELIYKEANDILVKTCPKELAKSALSYGMNDMKPILLYPFEGKGRISITVDDYVCLAQDQFLNDLIIDFYLKYLVLNLPKEQREKVHVFSTFFYKRLTTKPVKASRKSQPTELDPNLSPAQKRHARVKTWTKTVNLFEKDFIVVPINENCHWFLAVICFPNLNGSITMDGQPIKIESKYMKKKAAIIKKVIEKKVDPISCEEDVSDKDEAEGDDSELDTDESADEAEKESTVSVENNSSRPPIKQPCILIFDSLAPGASRSRVVATLRDYLTCEYKAKFGEEKLFTKDVIKGACPKVPQQTNFTDCGLYLLQYVEHLFKDPIKDYYIPISHLKNWFDEIVVTRKREEIALLIKRLMQESNKDVNVLPDIAFPTLNGEIVEKSEQSDPMDNFEDPDENEEMAGDGDDEEYLPPGVQKAQKCAEIAPSGQEEVEEETTGMRPSSDSVRTDLLEETIVKSGIFKPDMSELPAKQTNRETLSYLKAKRIVRHKTNTSEGGSEIKRARTEQDNNV